MRMGEKCITLILLASLILTLTIISCRAPAGRSTGQVVDDSTITTEVKARLPEQKHPRIWFHPDVSAGLKVDMELGALGQFH